MGRLTVPGVQREQAQGFRELPKVPFGSLDWDVLERDILRQGPRTWRKSSWAPASVFQGFLGSSLPDKPPKIDDFLPDLGSMRDPFTAPPIRRASALGRRWFDSVCGRSPARRLPGGVAHTNRAGPAFGIFRIYDSQIADFRPLGGQQCHFVHDDK